MKKCINIKIIYQVFGKKGVILCVTVTLLSAGMSVLQPFIVTQYKNLIDNINYLSPSVPYQIFVLISSSVLLYELLQLILHIVTTLSEHLSIWISYIISNEIQCKLHQKLDKIKYAELEKENTYNLISRISNSAADETVQTVNGLIGIFTGNVSALFYLFLLYKIKWYFPIIIISSMVPFFISAQKQNRDKYRLLKKMEGARRKMKYYQEIPLERNFIKDIKIFNLVDFFNKKAFEQRMYIEKEEIKLTIKYININLFVSLFRNCVWGICIFITALEVKNGILGVGNIILVIKSMAALMDTIRLFNDYIKSINSLFVLNVDWSDFYSLPEDNRCCLSANSNQDYTINFKNVDFKYPGRKEYALKNINLSIKPGEKISIVGENGSGKSTLIKLLLGLYEPTNGEIFIGHQKIADFSKKELLKIACVFQDFTKYQLSIEDNIILNREPTTVDNNFYRDLGLEQLLHTLPYDKKTILGQLYENGTDLSQGQWQKLAIARGVCSKLTKVLILDEPTASLDPQAENSIYMNFNKIFDKKTGIIITHRLGMCKLCNSIIVLQKGSVIEQGTHLNLMQRNGIYAEMFKAQQEIY